MKMATAFYNCSDIFINEFCQRKFDTEGFHDQWTAVWFITSEVVALLLGILYLSLGVSRFIRETYCLTDGVLIF